MARSRKKTRYKTRKPARSNPRGVVSISKAGYGFVRTPEGEFFIPASGLHSAADGDFVEISPRHTRAQADHSERPQARIVSVIDRAKDVLVGRYELAEPFGVVIPEDRGVRFDVFTQARDYPHIKTGDIVRVRIVNYPSRNQAATGIIEEVLGHEGESHLDSARIIAAHNFETSFSEAVLAEARACTLDATGALAEGYTDLSERLIFTIDPTDARDFDDALSFEQTKNGYRLGVHIADVSHYVPWNSALDLAARRRATSVYLVDQVLPMLPEALSNKLCSLVPGETRRTMTVDIYMNREYKVQNIDAYPALIRSCKRLSYDEALYRLTSQSASYSASSLTPYTGPESLERALDERLCALGRFAHARQRIRSEEGSLDFDTKELRMRLDDQGDPIGYDIREKTLATSLVEEAMILANVCVAQYLRNHNQPALFRIHERPASDGLSELIAVLQEFDAYAHIAPTRILAGNPFALQDVLSSSRGRNEERLISYLMLRAMQRACYKPYCDAHYGLAEDAYCHFTSPIRRYPDLVVHRMLKARLLGRDGSYEQQVHNLDWLASHSSHMERLAESASRESQEMKLIEYLKDSCGMSFAGLISGVSSHCVYVSLENTAEAMVPLSYLGDEYFSYDGLRHMLIGEDTGSVYRLGQKLQVQLVEADPLERRLIARPS